MKERCVHGLDFEAKKMKTLSIILIFFFCFNAFAQQFSPMTVSEMDATVTLKARGAMQGEVSSSDSMEVRFLVFSSSESQEVVESNDRLFFGGKEFFPEYEIENGNRYAVFMVENLLEFAATPEFEVESVTRIRTKSQIGLVEKSILENDLEKFLQPTQNIESDDTILQSKAEIEFSSGDSLETIREISQWVNSNIEYDFENYYNGVFTARETYDSRAGVCDEFANLSAAFARIKGIPAKYVVGISFDGIRFGNHGWLEVFLEDYGWVAVDSTFGEAGFVDAAHFALGKTTDAEESFNIRITTESLEKISVSTVLGQPQVQINSASFFEGITTASTDYPQKVFSEQPFTVRAKVKNSLGTAAIIPFELAVHNDFLILSEKLKIEAFEAGEEKTIEWELIAPKHPDEKTFLRYGIILFSVDQNINLPIEVHFSEEVQQKQSMVLFSDISPRLFENTLFVDIKVSNNGSEKGTYSVKAVRENGEILEETSEIEGFSEKTHTVEINGFEHGKIELSLESGSEQKKITINVPKEKEKPIEVTEEKTGPLPAQEETGVENPFEYTIFLVLGILVALAVVALVYFTQKK